MLSLSILVKLKRLDVVASVFAEEALEVCLSLYSIIMISVLFALEAVMFTITYFVMWVLSLT
jgi:hypothetical protein